MAYNFWIIYSFGLLFSLLGIISKNKKICAVIALLTLFFTLSSAVPSSIFWMDLNNYENGYYGMTEYRNIAPANDWAYYNLMFFLKNAGLSFMEAKAVIVAIIIALLFWFCKRFPLDVQCYILFFVFLNMIFEVGFLLRNSLGFFCLLPGLSCLMDDSIRHRTLKYTVHVIIAAQFHSSIYIFLLLLFVNLDIARIKRYRKVLVLGIAVGTIALIIMIRNGILIQFAASVVSNLLGSEKYSAYTAEDRSRFGWLYVMGVWGITVANSIFLTKKVQTFEDIEVLVCRRVTVKNWILKVYNECEDVKMYANACNRLIALCIVYAPLCIFTLHMHRFLQYMSILNLFYMALLYKVFRKNTGLRIYIFGITLVITLLWLYFAMNVYGAFRPEMIHDYMINGRWFWT